MNSLSNSLPGSIEFSHIGYVVDDLDKYITYFSDLFKISKFISYDYTPDIAYADGTQIEDCRLRLALGASDIYDFSIEIIQPGTGDTPHKRYLEENGSGLNHIAFCVSNYDAYRSALIEMEGSRIIFEADFTDDIKGRRRSFYITNPMLAGVMEITEIPTSLRTPENSSI